MFWRRQLCCCLGIFLKPFASLVGRHELFDPGVPAVDDQHAASDIDRDAIGKVELPFSIPKSAPLGDESAFLVELLDTVIAGVRNVNLAGSVDRNTPRRAQLTRLLRK